MLSYLGGVKANPPFAPRRARSAAPRALPRAIGARPSRAFSGPARCA